jgi:LysM repeat protein
MKKSVIHHMVLLLCAGCLFLAVLIPVSAQDGNLLQNPGFEEPFNTLDGDPPRQVAQGWTPWHVPAMAGAPSYEKRQPEYEPETGRVLEGSSAQLISSFFATHDGGVYQRVTGVTPGDTLRFSLFAYVWSSTGDNPDSSAENGDVYVQVGLDPTGGTDPGGEAIVWSAEIIEEYDAYNEYSVEAQAEADAVTVFVRTSVGIPVKNNNIYLDQAALVSLDGGAVEPTEAATEEAVETEAAAVEPTSEVEPVTEETVEAPTEESATVEATDVPADASTPTDEPTEDTSALTATAIIAEATVTAGAVLTETASAPVATATDDPLFLTATAIIAEATGTAGAVLTETASAPTATEDTIFLTATAIIEGATATAEADLTATANTVPPTAEATATATPTEPPISEQFPESISHTVSRGETVAILAARYGSTIEAIAQANGLDSSYFLQVGQVLIIPVAHAVDATPTVIVVTATPSGPVPALGTGNVYIVRPGDTLGRIARLFNTSVQTLAQLNGIVNVNQIQVGQQLLLPEPSQPAVSTQATATRTTAPPASSQPQTTYVVRPGDSLYRISLLFGVPIAQIAQANNLTNRNRIYVGQTLIIP